MRRLVLFCLCLLLLLVAASPAQAESDDDDRIAVVGAVTVPKGEVAHDVVVADGDVTVAGQVTGNLVVGKGTVKITGTVKGDVVAFADQVTIESGARVGGDVRYADTKPAVASGAQVTGKVERVNVDKVAGPAGITTGIGAWLAISISALLLGLLALWLVPRAALATSETGETRVGRSILWGLLLFFGIPILAVILLVTLLGLPLGVLMLLALLPLYSLGYTTGAWVLGRRILGSERARVLAFIAGLVILRLLALIPIVGGLVWFLATVLGLGVLFVAARRRPENGRGPAAVMRRA